ncbi:MAG: ethanolamine operon regulator [SAR86 cluster bacterium]|uniref:Ethanolamine operon regulator n=1 Tax=SAR86 cluster bacterium TaxID=2030880 RepID=A0A2A4MHV0_9GAMM|nr:MAG: ethanolamine operon regulator [SAR86 cluster bacterium]
MGMTLMETKQCKSAVEVQDLSFDAAEKQALAQDWVAISMKQLSAGSYQGRIRQIDFENYRVVVEEQNQTIQKLGSMTDKYCTVSYAHIKEGGIRASEYRPDDNALFLMPGGTAFDVQILGNTEIVYFRFEQDYLMGQAQLLNPSAWAKMPEVPGPFDGVDRKPIEQAVSYLLHQYVAMQDSQSILGSKAIEQELHDLVLLALVSGRHHNNDRKPGLKARRLVASRMDKVKEYIDAAHDANQCPGIIDLCAQLNVSERTLQYSFTKHLGVSPLAYLKIHRLNQVRAQLINPINMSDGVTTIAMRWHFWHMGQFSQDYKKMFNELPSATLKRALS